MTHSSQKSKITTSKRGWKELYLATEVWKSDLLFYKGDLRFLKHLVDNYFLWISNKDNIDIVRDTEITLLNTDKQCTNLLKRVTTHLSDLAELIDEPTKAESSTIDAEHQNLENSIAHFIQTARKNRKELFSITEGVAKSEKFVDQILNK